MIKKASELVKKMLVDRDTFVEMYEAQIQKLQAAGAPDWHIKDLQAQIYGGNCPECGMSYQRQEVKNPIADYYWYKPQCTCIDDKFSETEKQQRRERLLLNAKIPKKYWEASFGSWDYSVAEKTTTAMRKVLELHESGDLWEKNGLVLFGGVGTGKTHIGVAVIKKVLATKDVLFISTADIISKFLHDDEAEDIKHREVLMLDDFDKLASQNEWVKERIFSLIDSFIREDKFIVITANYETLVEIDDKMGLAVSSRLIGGCHIIELPGDDYRLVQLRRQNEKTEDRT